MKFNKRKLYLSLFVILLFFAGFYLSLVKDTVSFYSGVREFVQSKIHDAGFTVAIEIKDLDTHIGNVFLDKQVLAVNEDLPISAASLIKLPIMVSVYSAAREGKIDLDSLYKLKASDITGGSGILKARKPGTEKSFRDLLKLMISQSDNTASNIFIKTLGFDYLNESFQKMGLKETEVNRYIMDFYTKRKGIDNYVSVRDISLLLVRIYRKDCVGRKESQEMLDMLLAQKVDDRIVRYLPSNVKVANKTGTIRGIVHDSGIVFTKKGNYSICVLTRGSSTYIKPKRLIGKVSEIIYYMWNYR